MAETSVAPPALYPARIHPAAHARRFPYNLTKMIANNLEVIPADAYRKTVAVIPGPPRMAFFSGLDIVESMLLGNYQDYPKGRLQNELLAPIFGNAMISSEGMEWRWQRRAAAPLFRHEELLQYGTIMGDAAEATVARWRAAGTDTVHSIHKDMMRAAFRVISNTMLAGGAEKVLNAIEAGHSDYYASANWWVVYRMLGLPHWLPRPGGAAMRGYERGLRLAVTDLVADRRDHSEDGNDLLSRMVNASDPKSGRSMPDELLVDNIASFLMAGYDTTAFALTWTLYLVSQSPEWEARILEEVESVAGDAPISADHYSELTIVQQVLQESLRLFPTAPIIVRDINQDMEVDGVSIPAGSIGIIPIYAIHRHHDLWTDPDKFDPERFAPDTGVKRSRFQYMPFGAGPRICIGAAFSMMEIAIMIATFVRAARFETEPGFDPAPTGQMFLMPKNGMPMRVTMRDAAS